MPMTPLELQTVQKLAAVAKFLVQEVKPVVDALNVDYDSAGGVKSTLDQTKLDAEASLSGITKQQVDDGAYAITATLKDVLTNTFTQLEKLASRGVLTTTFGQGF